MLISSLLKLKPLGSLMKIPRTLSETTSQFLLIVMAAARSTKFVSFILPPKPPVGSTYVDLIGRQGERRTTALSSRFGGQSKAERNIAARVRGTEIRNTEK